MYWKNSLNGKTIKSIALKMIDAPSDIGMLTIVSIGIEVILTDGTVLKTKNLGGKTPYTDFKSEVKGGDFSGGDFKVFFTIKTGNSQFFHSFQILEFPGNVVYQSCGGLKDPAG